MTANFLHHTYAWAVRMAFLGHAQFSAQNFDQDENLLDQA